MSLLRFLQRRRAKLGTHRVALLERIAARIPEGGAPGLLPASDAEEAAEEARLAERFAVESHRRGRQELSGIGTSRRLAAIASSARRTSAAELEEAIRGVAPWELPELLGAVEARADVPAPRLAETARKLASQAADFPTLAGALALLAPGIVLEDRALLWIAGRSPALTGTCSRSLEALPEEEIDPALLELARRTLGVGRAMALERLAVRHLVDPPGFEALAPQALELAAAIEDPLERAWAAVPLLEVAGLPALLPSRPELGHAGSLCLEAVARGGWNGGPGPGLGRLPGAIKAAEAIFSLASLPLEVRATAARAVVDARPIPSGPARETAERILASV